MNATKMPTTIPGIEKVKLLIEIIATRYYFLNPSARNIPYSYVLLSTSDSIRLKTSIEAIIAKKTIIEKKVASVKLLILEVIPN